MKNFLKLATLALVLAIPAVGYAGDDKKCDPKDCPPAKCTPKEAAKCDAKSKADCCDTHAKAKSKKADKPKDDAKPATS